MDKAPDAYRTISEVADDLDLPQHVLRFWETRFAQIKPLKRGGGRRYYRPDDVELLKGIRHLLYREGYTIKGVQRILKEQGVRAVQAFARGAPAEAVLEPIETHPEPARFTPDPPVYAMPTAEVARGFAQDADDGDADDDMPQAEAADASLAAPQPPEAEAFPPPAPLTAFSAPPEPSPTPASARTQVSMFRGGLQRGDSAPAETPLSEFTDQIRARIENPLPRAASSPPLSGRETLQLALDELVACRARIDQILARRSN